MNPDMNPDMNLRPDGTNKRLSRKLDTCTRLFDLFVTSTYGISLEEKRTIKGLKSCKARAIETKNALNQFTRELENQAGIKDFPLS